MSLQEVSDEREKLLALMGPTLATKDKKYIRRLSAALEFGNHTADQLEMVRELAATVMRSYLEVDDMLDIEVPILSSLARQRSHALLESIDLDPDDMLLPDSQLVIYDDEELEPPTVPVFDIGEMVWMRIGADTLPDGRTIVRTAKVKVIGYSYLIDHWTYSVGIYDSETGEIGADLEDTVETSDLARDPSEFEPTVKKPILRVVK